MVHISTKGKEKVIEETPKRRPFTRSSATTTAERCMERKPVNVLFEIPDIDVVDVSIDGSENEGVGKYCEEKREKQGKNKRKRETSPVNKPASRMGAGHMGNEDDHGESK
ncbi:hypothetical protein KY284_001550 [Solanum tuberosum]|nr:hypothetical protein KY284_001550 [Solanum tuberosum]